jgi:2',3'-cyclic-nucleotide 2'-phosphodiesterase (5'-nucleotidase family)
MTTRRPNCNVLDENFFIDVWRCSPSVIVGSTDSIGSATTFSDNRVVPSLRIIAINDVYSLENLPRLRGLVDHYRDANPADVLLVTLAGDFLAPSILSTLDGGRGMVDCLNAVGITDVTLGNHEDDVPKSELVTRIHELDAKMIVTNIEGLDASVIRSRVVVVPNASGDSVRVGLVGVVMDDADVYRRAPFGGATIAPPLASLTKEAARLVREEGCVCVLPLTHQTMDADRALARAKIPRMPVILGGHEHDVHLEQVEGIWIVKAGIDAQHAVVVDLRWANAASTPDVNVYLDDVAKYPENEAIRTRVDRHMVRVHELETAALVELAEGEELSSIGTRTSQTSMGALICSRVRDALDAEACIFNGGGIRGRKSYRKHITYADLKAEVPFDNEVVVALLPGGVLRDAIAESRRRAPEESPAFLQVDDRMTLEQPGNRLTQIDKKPLDLDRDYRIAVVRDLLLGLDHIEPLAAYLKDHPERIPSAGSGREIKILLIDAMATALWNQLGGFDAVDRDHDGVVTMSEVEAVVANVTHEAPSPITAGLVIRALDRNHDGSISRSEAKFAAAKPHESKGDE